MSSYSIKYIKSYITICLLFVDGESKIQYNKRCKKLYNLLSIEK